MEAPRLHTDLTESPRDEHIRNSNSIESTVKPNKVQVQQINIVNNCDNRFQGRSCLITNALTYHVFILQTMGDIQRACGICHRTLLSKERREKGESELLFVMYR